MHIDDVNYPIEEAWSGELKPPGQVFTVRDSGQPVVSIGRPDWWPDQEILGQNWRPPAGGRRYGLARFAFTLDPQSAKSIESADLTVQLLTTGSGENPVAYDLFPLDLKETRKDALKLSVIPSLKFSEVEASLGGVETTLDATNAVPVITAFGLSQSAVRWNFQSQATYPLSGSRIVYAIIAVPPGAPGVRVSLQLIARTKSRWSSLITNATPPEAAARLSHVLGS